MNTHRVFQSSLAVLTLLLSLTMARASDSITGVVKETLEAGRYTYLLVDTGSGEEWVATSHVEAKPGDKVTMDPGNVMKDFESPTLQRTFERIRFTQSVSVGDTPVARPSMPAGHPPMGGGHGMGAAHGELSPGSGIAGEIVETLDAGNYTYLRVRNPEKTMWVATERLEARVGERVRVQGGMISRNFESPILKRTFDEVLFAESVALAGDEDAPAEPAAPVPPPPAASTELIPQPEGALTVEAIVTRRAELAGKEVTVKGRVVKYTERVLDRNWMHLADGTAAQGLTDITVNTTERAAKGELLTVKGTVAIDEDLGHGYQYPVLLKDATITARD